MDFKDGYITYETLFIKTLDNMPKDTVLSRWDDGYLAFSNVEIRIDDEIKRLDVCHIANSRINEFENLTALGGEGYLMELDVWRKEGDTIEEMTLERMDNGWFYQRWKLKTEGFDKPNCFYNSCKVTIRNPNRKIFHRDDIGAVEVIVPDKRLNFYITTRGGIE